MQRRPSILSKEIQQAGGKKEIVFYELTTSSAFNSLGSAERRDRNIAGWSGNDSEAHSALGGTIKSETSTNFSEQHYVQTLLTFFKNSLAKCAQDSVVWKDVVFNVRAGIRVADSI